MAVKELLIQDGNNNASYPRTRTDVVRESPTLNARYNSPHPGKDYAVLDNVF